MSQLNEKVYLVNTESKVDLKWDGEEFSIIKNQKKELPRGVAEHFANKHQSLVIEEIEVEPLEPRELEGQQGGNEKPFENLDGNTDEKKGIKNFFSKGD